jgi:hypothetical protein
MSSSLLTTRLRSLERWGVVARVEGEGGEWCYRLTSAGEELGPVVEELGRWGQRWLASPRLGDLDPELLVYDICREIDRARLPADPLTVEVDFTDAVTDVVRPRRWWLSLSATEVRIRRIASRTGATVRLTATLGALAGVWLGHLTWLQAVRDRSIMLAGDSASIRSLIDCVGVSRYAAVPRGVSGGVSGGVSLWGPS